MLQFLFQIEVISSQFNLSGFSDQITDILKGLKCEVIAETRQYEPKPCNEDIRGQVYILVSRSGMMAEITIRARYDFLLVLILSWVMF